MLMGFSDQRQGKSTWRAASVVERRFKGGVFRRARLRFDTRYSPPSRHTRGVVTLCMLQRGWASLDGGAPQPGPVAYLLSEDERERRRPDAPSLQLWGEACEGIELQFETPSVQAPVGLGRGPLRVSQATWLQLGTAVHALAQPQIDRTGATAAIAALVAWLARDGTIVTAVRDSIVGTEAPNIARLWDGIAAMYEENRSSATLNQLRQATGVSLAQLGRDMVQLSRTFGLSGLRYREAVRLMRLRSAVLWLSSPGISVTEVARYVGYGSIDAMARAFRDASLEAPTRVQAAVRCPEE